MSLELDERQRAMLAEMGVQVWLPEPEPPAPQPRSAAAAPVAAPVQAPPARQDVSRPAAARVPGPPSPSAERRPADWMIVGESAGEGDDLPGDPFAGQSDKLLDNMLRAMGLARERNVFIAHSPRYRAAGQPADGAADAAQAAMALQQQVEQVQPKVILAMGRSAAQQLLQSTEPIGRLRGQVHHYRGVPVVVTYPPAYLLRNPADKAKAWADLCLAMGLLPPAG